MPSFWPLAQEAMDVLQYGEPTPETLIKARSLCKQIIGQAARGSDELIAAYYVMSTILEIQGDQEGSLRYLLAYGKEMLNP